MPKETIVQITHFSKSQFRRIASKLECKDHKELIDHIKQYAYGHSKNNLYKTYILMNGESPIGYISFSLSNIDNEEKIQDKADISSSISYPISALQITRLLVSDKFQGQNYGTQLLHLADILAFIIAYQVGCKLIIVDAKSGAEGFYTNKNFQSLKINKNDTVLMFKNVNENIPNDLLERYINFCKCYSLKTLEIYLCAIKAEKENSLPTNP